MTSWDQRLRLTSLTSLCNAITLLVDRSPDEPLIFLYITSSHPNKNNEMVYFLQSLFIN